MSARVKLTLGGLAIGLVFLWLALLDADLAATWQALRRIEWVWACVTFAAGVGFMAVKTWRWSRILGPFVTPGFGTLHSAVYIGTAANLMIAHTGEILRSTLLARRQQVAASAVLASVAVERVFDFIALLVVLGLALVWDPGVSPILMSAGLVTLGFVAVGLVGLLAFLNPTPSLRRAGNTLLGLFPDRARGWIVGQLEHGLAGLASMRNAGLVLQALALSLLQWAFIVAAVWASARAVGLSVPVPGAIAVFVLTVIGLTLPSSPAQVGTTQLAFVAGLQVFGVAPAAAFAASWVYTCFVVVAMMLLGALCWVGSDWSPAAGPNSPA